MRVRSAPFAFFWLYAVPGPAASEPRPDVAYLAYTQGFWQVWVMAADGTGQTQVTRSTYDKSRLSWHPDGSRLLVNGNQGTLAWVVVADGSEVPITTELQGMSDAVLSPDGRWIAFSLSTGGTVDHNNIWLVTHDGKELRKLTQLPNLQHEPAWSPDSRAVYFLSGAGDQTHDIWRVSIADQSLEQLTTSQLYHFDVAVGANGALAFSSNRSGNYEIWVWPAHGEPRALTDHPALDARPTWSPDGSRLVFESTRGGVSDLWTIPVAGGEPRQLTHTLHGARFPVWKPGAPQR